MTAYIVYILIHLIILLTSISSNAVSVAFPEITSSFNASLVLAGWVISIYQLVAVCTSVIIGSICDILGRKTVFLVCTGLFILGSILCAIAPNIQILIVSRFIQSFGGGGIVPVVVGIIVDLFPRSRQKAIGLSVSFFTIGGIIGPNIGAALLTAFGWRSIFWLNVPSGILACIPLFFLLKTDKRKGGHVNLQGTVYLTGMIFAIMIGLSQIGDAVTHNGWLYVIILFAIGILFLLLLIRHETKAKEPVIDLELLKRKPFAAADFYNIIYGACVFGVSSFIPLFAISVYGMSELQSSRVLSVRSIGMILATIASSFFALRWGYRRPLLAGTLLISISIFIMGLEPHNLSILGNDLSPLIVLCILNLVFGIGMGVSTPASSNCCIDLLPEKAASITGVIGMFRMGGGAVCIPIITLFLQYMDNISTGFQVTLIGIGIVALATIPFIFIMHERNRDKL